MERKISDRELIGRLLGFLLPYKGVVFFTLLFILLSKSIEALIPIYVGKISQEFLTGFSLDFFERSALFAKILRNLGNLVFLLFFAYILEGANVFLRNRVGQKAVYHLRTKVYRHIQEMPVEYYNNNPVGSLMTRVIHDVDQINQLFSESLIPLVGNLLLFICIFVGMILFEWKLAIAMALVFPFAVFLIVYFSYHQRRCYKILRGIVSSMNAFVQEYLMGAATVRSFGLQEREKKHFDKINKDYRNTNVETIHYFSFFFAGIDLLQSLAMITLFVVLVVFALPNEGFQAGTYFTFSLYVLMLFRPLLDLVERYNILQSAMAAAERIFHVMDQKTEDFEKGIKKPENPEISTIDFEDVWFAYEKENWVLKGLTFSVKGGEMAALVGMTGAGKTTVTQLLLRFYDFQRGSIKINGVDIRKFSLKTIRSLFSVVLQDPEIFSGTISENISFYRSEISKEKIESAVASVSFKETVSRFSDGVDHFLSERGKSLSAGEKQLLSLARAFANEREAVILDEATANIDSRTEEMIKKGMQALLQEKTSIVIAHRLSTIKKADKIIVLHGGVACEIGTHRELLEKKGVYEKLYRLQYKDI